MFKSKKYIITIIPIPDDLWNEIKNILRDEKPDNTRGRPVVPYRKVLEGIIFILRTGCQWETLPKERIWIWFYISSEIPGMGRIRKFI